MSRNHYILLGGAAHASFFENNAVHAGEQWFWTCPKGARKGDVGFVYLCAPLSRVVGRVEFIAEPFFNVDMFPRWSDKWMVEIGLVEHFEAHRELRIAGLRELFPDWGWLRYPRGNARIPEEILKPFLELFDGSEVKTDRR